MHKHALPSALAKRSLARLLLAASLTMTAGCDVLGELLEIPNPAREQAAKEAEGRAVGGACRHAGRSLEDCYALNPSSEKAAVFAGWRDMNDYMMEHKLDTVPSVLVPEARQAEPGTAASPGGATAPAQ
ncbi:hypothetical protein [Thauera butanivorans]|jgi:hypothetical protein|uniref:hypothetical protein n=1 Tax=Thauera butanivorans TaxID=86174 RepID=UPI000837E90E